jgi:hypothetical protein
MKMKKKCRRSVIHGTVEKGIGRFKMKLSFALLFEKKER